MARQIVPTAVIIQKAKEAKAFLETLDLVGCREWGCSIKVYDDPLAGRTITHNSVEHFFSNREMIANPYGYARDWLRSQPPHNRD